MARKTEKCGKFINIHCRTWNMARKLNIMENEKHPLDDFKNDKITKKTKKMINAHCRTWNMARKLKKNRKWEIHTLGREIWRGTQKKLENLEMSTVGHGIWQENWKSWKMRNIHLTTWKMRKSLTNVKNEKCTL